MESFVGCHLESIQIIQSPWRFPVASVCPRCSGIRWAQPAEVKNKLACSNSTAAKKGWEHLLPPFPKPTINFLLKGHCTNPQILMILVTSHKSFRKRVSIE